MAETTKEVVFDVRLIERHLRQGLITREEYEKHLAQLSDAEAEADVIDTDVLAVTAGTGIARGQAS